MKKNLYLLGAVCMTLFLASCGGSESEESGKKEELCFYSLNTENYTLTWTAYKTTDKVPVSGTFNEIDITAPEAETVEDAIKGISFTISTESVESNDEERNGKIVEYFFMEIVTPYIEGKVTSVDLKNNKATVLISMNSIEVPVEGTLTVDGDSFKFEANIQMASWDAESGIQALNEVCSELHTGNDGVSKLWSEVTIGFSGTLNKKCD